MNWESLELFRWDPQIPAPRLSSRFPRVDEYDLQMDVTRLANSFRCSTAHLGATNPMESGDVVAFSLSGELVFVGRVDRDTLAIEPGREMRTAVGRDLGYFLVDNAMPFTSSEEVGILNVARRAATNAENEVVTVDTSAGRFTFNPAQEVLVGAAALGQAAARLASAEIFASVEARNASNVMVRTKTEPGETRADFLARYLKVTGNIAHVSPAGSLIVGGLGDPTVVGRIDIGGGRSNVSSAQIVRAPALSPSRVRVLSSSNEDLPAEAGFESATATRPGVRGKYLQRSVVVPGPDSPTGAAAKQLAEHILQEGARDDLQVQVAMAGHRLGGRIPKIDQMWEVNVLDEVREPLYLKAVRYSRGRRDDVSTTMHFVRRATVAPRAALDSAAA